MAAQFDSLGLAITASSPASVALFEAALFSYLGMRNDALSRTAAVLLEDPGCVLAHCLNGYLNMHSCRFDGMKKTGHDLAKAKALADSIGVGPREEVHLAALEAWHGGNLIRALECWEQILAIFPLDILALRLAQFMTSYLGQSEGIRDSVSRVFPSWNAEMPGYGFVLSCYAYGLEEAGDYEKAEQFGRFAVDMNPEDLWGAHAVAHVMEMQGRVREGVEWITSGQKNWQQCGNFVNHLWWHCALLHLAAAKYDEALELYDRKVSAKGSDEYLDLANAAALLWRLEQAGVNAGDRWCELVERVGRHLEEHFFVFVDLHNLIAIAANSTLHAQEFLNSCSHYTEKTNSTEAHVMRDVGLSLARAIVAHRSHAYGEATDLLLSIKDLIPRIGGSHAQRDLFEQLVIDSAIRADRLMVARSLLLQRIGKRPRELWAWRTLASLLEALGETDRIASARSEIARIMAGKS